MRVRFVHDDFIRVTVDSAAKGQHVFALKKAMLTASCKSVDASWSSGDNVHKLNSEGSEHYDIILTSNSESQHHIGVHEVVDATNCEMVHSISLQGRSMICSGESRDLRVQGTSALAKHLIKKSCRISALACSGHVARPLPAYHSEEACLAVFRQIMLARETATAPPMHRGACIMKTVGSEAFKLFQTYNSSVTSKLASAFPQQNLPYAQSLCLAAAFAANSTDAYTPVVVFAHTMQRLPVSEAVAATLRRHTLGAAAVKSSRLSLLTDRGALVYRQVYTVDSVCTELLGTVGVHTRAQTPMYLVFDGQQNAILLADVSMHPGLGVASADLADISSPKGAITVMHYVNVAVAYHPKLEPHRELLMRKCFGLLRKPGQFMHSVFNMLRFETGPALPLLGAQDLLLDTAQC